MSDDTSGNSGGAHFGASRAMVLASDADEAVKARQLELIAQAESLANKLAALPVWSYRELAEALALEVLYQGTLANLVRQGMMLSRVDFITAELVVSLARPGLRRSHAAQAAS